MQGCFAADLCAVRKNCIGDTVVQNFLFKIWLRNFFFYYIVTNCDEISFYANCLFWSGETSLLKELKIPKIEKKNAILFQQHLVDDKEHPVTNPWRRETSVPDPLLLCILVTTSPKLLEDNLQILRRIN